MNEKKMVLWNTMNYKIRIQYNKKQCKRNKIKSKCSRQKETAENCSHCDFGHMKQQQQHPCHGNEIIKIGLEVLIDWEQQHAIFAHTAAACTSSC